MLSIAPLTHRLIKELAKTICHVPSISGQENIETQALASTVFQLLTGSNRLPSHNCDDLGTLTGYKG